jgi:hypothetical protein
MVDLPNPVRTCSAVLGLAFTFMMGCAPDYVYIQQGKSEGQVRQDYIGCAEQQFNYKVSNDTSVCMERKGYHAHKIDESSRASTAHILPPPPSRGSSQ